MVPASEGGGMRATMQEGMLAILSGFMDPQVHCVVSLDGHVDEERLARAVRLSLDALPVLGSRLAGGRGQPRWLRRADLDRLELVTVETASDTPSAVERALLRTMDPSADPLVRATVIRGRADTLVVSVCHVAADGRGVQEYAYLLADLYTGLGEGRETPSVAVERCTMRGALGALPPARSMAAILRAVEGFVGFPMRSWKVPAVTSCGLERGYIVRRVGRDRVAAARALASRHGATLNDALLTAFYRALFEALSPPPKEPMPVLLPADLRRHMPSRAARGVCPLVSVLVAELDRRPGEAFEGTLLRVRDEMRALRDGDLAVGNALLLGLVTGAGQAATRSMLEWPLRGASREGSGPPLFSNAGPMDGAMLGFGGVRARDAYTASPVFYPPFFMLGLSGFAGDVVLTAGFCGDPKERARVEGILDRMLAELPAPTGWPPRITGT